MTHGQETRDGLMGSEPRESQGRSEPTGKLRRGWAGSGLPKEDSPGGKCWVRGRGESVRAKPPGFVLWIFAQDARGGLFEDFSNYRGK